MIYFRFILELLFLAIVCYSIYHEKDLIKIEQKIKMYITAFLKACYYSCKEVIQK